MGRNRWVALGALTVTLALLVQDADGRTRLRRRRRTPTALEQLEAGNRVAEPVRESRRWARCERAPLFGRDRHSGGRYPDAIRQVIRGATGAVRWCYERELPAAPRLSGRLMVELLIEPRGYVRIARVRESTLDAPAVERCVLRTVRRLRFPEVSMEGLEVVRYPFVFRPEGVDGPEDSGEGPETGGEPRPDAVDGPSTAEPGSVSASGAGAETVATLRAQAAEHVERADAVELASLNAMENTALEEGEGAAVAQLDAQRLGELGAAARLLARALALLGDGPEGEDISLALAVLWLEIGEDEAAAERLTAFLSSAASGARIAAAQLLLGELREGRGEPDMAVRLFEAAASSGFPEHADPALYRLAWSLAGAQEWQRSVDTFLRVIALPAAEDPERERERQGLRRSALDELVSPLAEAVDVEPAARTLAAAAATAGRPERLQRLLRRLADTHSERGRHRAAAAALALVLEHDWQWETELELRQERIAALRAGGDLGGALADTDALLQALPRGSRADRARVAQWLAEWIAEWHVAMRRMPQRRLVEPTLRLYDAYLAAFPSGEHVADMGFQRALFLHEAADDSAAAGAAALELLRAGAAPRWRADLRELVQVAAQRAVTCDPGVRSPPTPSDRVPRPLLPTERGWIAALDSVAALACENGRLENCEDEKLDIRLRAATYLYDRNLFDEAIPRLVGLVRDMTAEESHHRHAPEVAMVLLSACHLGGDDACLDEWIPAILAWPGDSQTRAVERAAEILREFREQR